MNKIVIFDFDGTIGTLVVNWTEWRKDIKDLIYNLEPDSNINLEDIRHANQNDLIKKYGSEFRKGLNKINEHSEQVLVTDFIVNQKVLDYIKSTDNELYCWSSNSRKTLNKYLTEVGVINRFKNIVSREDTYFLKPDNEGFRFIKDQDVPLKEYLFVGDSDVDKVAAKESGIDFMHVVNFNLRA